MDNTTLWIKKRVFGFIRATWLLKFIIENNPADHTTLSTNMKNRKPRLNSVAFHFFR